MRVMEAYAVAVKAEALVYSPVKKLDEERPPSKSYGT
jgi:hypothetical protein